MDKPIIHQPVQNFVPLDTQLIEHTHVTAKNQVQIGKLNLLITDAFISILFKLKKIKFNDAKSINTKKVGTGPRVTKK